MLEVDQRVADALERVVPSYEREIGAWDAVLVSAQRRRRFPRVALALAPAVIALAALALAWPFGDEPRGGVLERALAAAGDGPVLHVVFREGWGGTLVDLRTGERKKIHGERELWYDPERGLHDISRFGGVLQHERVYPPPDIAPYQASTLAFLATDYRAALDSGNARVLGSGELDGIPVYWIRVHAESNEDVADGKLHEWAHDVAVSRETYKPVGTRETLDGKDSPDGPARIVHFETLAAGEGDFTVETDSLDGVAEKREVEPISLEQAAAVLGATPLWLGHEFAGVRLARVDRTETTLGRRLERRVDPKTVVSECRARARRAADERAHAVCDDREQRFRRGGGPIVVTAGPPTWGATYTGIRLTYAMASADGEVLSHPYSLNVRGGAYVALAETTRPHRFFARGALGYVPPVGTVLTFGPFGRLYRDGVHVAIEASSADLVVAAARALKPIPTG